MARLRWSAVGLELLFILTLLWQRREQERLEAAPERDLTIPAPGFGRHGNYEIRPVFLEKTTTPDPATVGLSQSIAPINFTDVAKLESKSQAQLGSAASPPSIDLSDDILRDQTPEQSAAELDRIIKKHGSSKALVLPTSLAPHFEGLPDEEVIWTSPFSTLFGTDGTFAISNKRIMVAYTRKLYSLFPPKLITQQRRHQTPLIHLTDVEAVEVGRQIFLVAALPLLVWFPIGALLAAFAIGAYFVFRRRELGLYSTRQQKRSYPLRPDKINEAQAVLKRLMTKRPSETVRLESDHYMGLAGNQRAS